MISFINSIDQTILFYIHMNFHFPIIDKIMILATTVGDKGLIWILISLLLLMDKKTRGIGILTLATLVLSTIIGEGLLKHIIQRPRPYVDFTWINLLIDQSTTYSFPSGHTTSSFAAAYVLARHLKKFLPIIWTVATIIAFSRLYLFVHYPSDVVAGMVLGISCGKFASCLYKNRWARDYSS
ncbi:MAG TPA: phosphatase PAP2 family protein [Clostridiales bacterium]|nr:phosphatase PAP2 family protein [Clostridiales bacterium]